MDQDKKRVLIICGHNSARSQMAQAWLELLAGDRFAVQSAGFEPRPINPLVVDAMREVGVNLSNKGSQSVFDVYRRGGAFQYVISVCSRDTEANCPIFPGVHRNRIHVVFPDPCLLTGSREERLEEVRKVRDEIKGAVEEFLRWVDAGGAGIPGPRWGRT